MGRGRELTPAEQAFRLDYVRGTETISYATSQRLWWASLDHSDIGNAVTFDVRTDNLGQDLDLIYAHSQRRGIGTRAIQWFTGLLDKHGVTCTLTAGCRSRDDMLSYEILVPFYLKHGWEPLGWKKMGPKRIHRMIRRPRTP